MKMYLAGPMSGIPEYNFPKFDKAIDQLVDVKLEVVSPHSIDHGETPENRGKLPYETYIRAGLKLLLECDGIIMMDGWELSKGCMTELYVASACGMRIYFYNVDRDYLFTNSLLKEL